jgi:hypothetical protein
MAPPGNQGANGKNKPQPAVLVETGLLDSNASASGTKADRNKKRKLQRIFSLDRVPSDGCPRLFPQGGSMMSG